MKLKVGLAVASLVAAMGAWFAFSPSMAVTALADAIYSQDADEIRERVDTVRVKERLQSYLSETMIGPVLDDEVDNPFEGFGRLAATSMLPAMVDRLVSPEGLRDMLEGQSNSADPSDLSWEISRDGLDRFSAKLSNSDEAANFIFERDGLSWLLVEIRKPGDPFSQDRSSENDSADVSSSTPVAREESGIISEWKRSNLNGVQNDTLMEYDCDNRRYRVAAIEVTDANGYKIEQAFPDDMPWHQVTDRDFEAQTAVVRVTNEGVDDYFRVCGRPSTEVGAADNYSGIKAVIVEAETLVTPPTPRVGNAECTGFYAQLDTSGDWPSGLSVEVSPSSVVVRFSDYGVISAQQLPANGSVVRFRENGEEAIYELQCSGGGATLTMPATPWQDQRTFQLEKSDGDIFDYALSKGYDLTH